MTGARSIDASGGPRLHVGCGRERLDGWVNVDRQLYPSVDVLADVTDGLAFAAAEAVYAEHFLEHLTLDRALDFLVECHRALREGGALRLTTPNLDWLWKTHYRLEEEDPELRRKMALALNLAFYGWEHRFLWNREMLEAALAACGFVDRSFHRHGESDRELFQGIERHETYRDAPGLHHVLIVEACKGPETPADLAALRATVRDDLLRHMKG